MFYLYCSSSLLQTLEMLREPSGQADIRLVMNIRDLYTPLSTTTYSRVK